jgi:hypothetical protein
MKNPLPDDWLWDPPLGIPEAEDYGPGLSDAELEAWERANGVRLPAILRRAFKQQDGGRVRDSERGAAFVRLHDFTPVNVADLDMTYANEDGRFDTGRLIDVGYDDVGANYLLHYVDGTAEPVLYFHFNDGGTVEDKDGCRVSGLWPEALR